MARKRYTAEQIIGILRGVGVAEGKRVGETVRDLGITEQTYWSYPDFVDEGFGKWLRSV